jgi:tripartite ATP-independent transporter DctM subunit
MAFLETATADTSAASSLNPMLRFALLIERSIVRFAEAVSAILVASEICLLFSGVVARYVFRSPIFWTDEFASLLFIWLSLFGSIVALSRGEHMALKAIASILPKTGQHVATAISTLIIILFLGLILPSTYEHFESERMITLPALDFSAGYRASAMGVSLVLMLVVALGKLVRQPASATAVGLIAVGVLAGALWLLQPNLAAMGNYNLLVFFVGIVGFSVFLGVPICFAFGIATLAFLLLAADMPLTVLVGRMDEGMSHSILISVPLFVFLGSLIVVTGMAASMVEFLASLLGHVRGGLSYVLLGGICLVSGISGSKAADMAAIAPALLPEMRKRGANMGEQVALMAAAAALSETIPPSIVLIGVGSVTGVSIAALFTGGVMPALVLAAIMAGVVYLQNRKSLLPVLPRAPLRLVLKLLVAALPSLLLPLVIRTAVVEGVASATEVATIGVGYSFIVALILRQSIPPKDLYRILVETASLSGAILFIIGTATGMAWALAQSGFSSELAQLMGKVPGGWLGFMAVTVVGFVILGSLLEGLPALILFCPLLFPIAKSMGIHEVQYAMVVILAMSIGLFAPPLGVGFYTACAIGRVHPDEVMKPIWICLLALLLSVFLVVLIPWISTGFL